MKTFLFALFLLIGSTVFANPVDVATAKLVGSNYFKSTTKAKVQELALADQTYASGGDTALYYVFNVGNNNGWIIISASDAAIPVLAYNTSGTYSIIGQPPAFEYWMEGCETQLRQIVRLKLKSTSEIELQWNEIKNYQPSKAAKSTTSVGPLLSTLWDQDGYYNDWCPGNCPTGCVATAMAQIMKYWNSPVTGTSDHCYNHPAYGQLCANFGTTVYDWGAMPNTVSSPNTPVATLMYHAGVSVEMDYCQNGSNVSGAWVLTNDPNGYHPYSAQHAYPTYFGYNPNTIQGKLRSSYTDSYWINSVLKPELDASTPRPIQYVGWDVNGEGGHTWVCDGYNSSNYFHMNWGWGGTNDGWFSINNLNPGSYHFDNGQQALIGIQPSSGSGSLPNDNCGSSAIALTSNTTCIYTPGTVAGATSSGLAIPNCSGYQSQTALDVWFQFIAVNSEHTITVDPEGNTTGNNNYLDAPIALYGSCSNSGFIECFDQTGGGGETTTHTFSGLTPGNTYYVRVFDFGTAQPIYPGFNICITHSGGGVNLEYSGNEIDDDASGGSNGDADGLCEPGEDIELNVELINSGSEDASNVAGVLSTSDPDITITDANQSWGTITAGGTDWTSDFDFSVSSNCQEKDVTFTLDITSDEGSWTDTFIVHIYGNGGGGGVVLGFSQYEIDDDASGGSNGDADGLCEPGEDIELNVELINSGSEDASNVAGVLSTSDPDITITDANQSWGTITAGGTYWTSDFDFSVSSNCQEKDVTFTLAITSDEGSWTDTFVIHIYGSSGGGCTECPSFDFDLTCDEDWQTHASEFASGGCKLYKFIVANGDTYTFKTGCYDGATASFDTYLTLLDQNCNEITYDDDNCEEYRSKIEWLSNQPDGTPVFLKVTGFSDAAGSFTLAYKKESELSFNVNVSANPNDGGNVIGGGSYPDGSIVEVDAYANYGYNFSTWMENGNIVSTSSSYSFVISNDRVLIANFAVNPPNYTITAYAIPANCGYTYGGGSFPTGTVVNLVAVPQEGYKFEYWVENGNVVNTNSIYTFTVINNRILYAYFSEDNFTDVKEAKKEADGEKSFVLYPNPVSDILNIKSLTDTKRKYTLTVYNSEGKILRREFSQFNGNEKTYSIDVSELQSGMYFLWLQSIDYQQMLKFVRK